MTRKSGSGPANRDRRSRREAQRQVRRAAPPPAKRRSASRLSPLSIVTAAAVLVGILVVGFLVLQNRAPTTIAEPAITTPPTLASNRTLGAASAPVTLDVWSDFQCPGCQQFWTTIEPKVVSTFVATGRARLVYHDFTFIGPESLDAAVAARCADRQGKFWPYHDLLYANQGKENSGAFSRDRLAAMAAQTSLDILAWTSCLSDTSITAAIQAETTAGRQAGVNSTPKLMVNGKTLASYDYTTVANAIQAAFAAASPAASPSPSASASASATAAASPAASASAAVTSPAASASAAATSPAASASASASP